MGIVICYDEQDFQIKMKNALVKFFHESMTVKKNQLSLVPQWINTNKVAIKKIFDLLIKISNASDEEFFSLNNTKAYSTVKEPKKLDFQLSLILSFLLEYLKLRKEYVESEADRAARLEVINRLRSY